jgi:hypothetical protein
LSRAFKTAYFRTLQAQRREGDVDLAGLTRRFYQLRTLRGHKSLQFSFITKLAHTINPAYPIYDREVATTFGFRSPVTGRFDAKLDRLLAFYEWLRRTYAEILAQRLMAPCIEAFRTAFPGHTPAVLEVKILDFLFWSVGKLQRQNRLRDSPRRGFDG